VLTSQQAEEFANRGFVLIPQVVPGDRVNRANARVDELIAADPPADGSRGNHFYFLTAAGEPALLATLTGTPAFGLAGELAGPGTLEEPGQVQVALNIPPFPHRPGIPHIDAGNDKPDGEPTGHTFTLLAGVLLTDQLTEDAGNLWVWPGTHLVHAAYFRAHGPEQFCAYPPVPLPAPEQVTGRAGDLLLAHYLLGHNIGGNVASRQVRRALYFRVSARGHASRRSAFLQDPWLDYPAVRARNGQPPA
jgi:Phytanoyl-CoA dioxygenase (PhyH)